LITDNEIIKKRLSSLTDLDTETIKSLSAKQLLSFVQILNITASTYPMQKEALEYAYAENDYASFIQWLQVINSGLIEIHAAKLVKESEKFVNINQDTTNAKHERFKVFHGYFVPSLDILFNEVHKVLVELEVEEVDVQKDNEILGPEDVRKRLLALKELDSNKIEDLSDENLCKYVQTLNGFHAEFKAQEHGLRSSLKINHYAFVIQWLTAIEKTLEKIYASELASVCRNHIESNKNYNNIRPEKFEVDMNYFLSSLEILSEDIKSINLPLMLIATSDNKEALKNIDLQAEILSPGFEGAKTILIINKMKMFMNSMKNALSDTQYRLVGVTSIEAAANFLKNTKPDLFFVDEDLHGANSYTLIRIIRAAGQNAPIIFTTSTITRDSMIKFMEAGVADFIMKPITPSDVKNKVANFLSL
jgi:CheY-like chemotaxis protein